MPPIFEEPWFSETDPDHQDVSAWLQCLEAIIMEAEGSNGPAEDEPLDALADLLNEARETQQEIYQFVEDMKPKVERLKRSLKNLRK